MTTQQEWDALRMMTMVIHSHHGAIKPRIYVSSPKISWLYQPRLLHGMSTNSYNIQPDQAILGNRCNQIGI